MCIMTQQVVAEDDDIDLLHALKTAFSKDGDPEMFLARAADQIRQVESTIIETCAKNRIRIDDNLYALLESRDAISEQTQELDKSTQTASEITTTVNTAVSNLSDKLQIRKNLDAALAVAAQTRKLTRMYARIEDTIDSRRLFTAFRMLKMFEDETRSVQPHTVLQELVPDSRRLRAQITQHALRACHGWHSTVRRFEHPLGAYAMHHAAAQALSNQTLFESPRGALGESFALLSSLPPAPPRGRGVARPFIPLLTQSPVPERAFGTAGRGIARSILPVANSFSLETGMHTDVGRGTGRLNRSGGMDDSLMEVPTLYLRPLLQGVLVGEGLQLLTDMKSEYRRERLGHLKRILEGMEEDEYEGGHGEHLAESDVESPPPSTVSRARQIERLVLRVAGFFVVERSVEMHCSHMMVARETVDGEWWSLAYSKLLSVFKEHEESALESPSDKAVVRGVEENLERFAQMNGLIK